MRGGLGIGVILLATLWGAPAAAVNEPLARAGEALASMDYEEIVPLLIEADRLPMTREERARHWELQGIIHAIYGRDDLAVEAFFQMLLLVSDYAADLDVSPKISTLLVRARARHQAEVNPPPSEPAATAAPSEPVVEAAAPASEPAVATVPDAAVNAAVAPPEPEPAVYERWYFWVGIGAGLLVAGGVTAGAILGQPRYPPHDFPVIELSP